MFVTIGICGLFDWAFEKYMGNFIFIFNTLSTFTKDYSLYWRLQHCAGEDDLTFQKKYMCPPDTFAYQDMYEECKCPGHT